MLLHQVSILKHFLFDDRKLYDICSNISNSSYNRHAERLDKMLQATKGKIEIGGRLDIDNKFLEPTVITGVDLEDSTMQV